MSYMQAERLSDEYENITIVDGSCIDDDRSSCAKAIEWLKNNLLRTQLRCS